MKLSKCHFFTKEIQYLRHILSAKGIRPLPSQDPGHNQYGSTKKQLNKYAYIPWTHQILQEIYEEICQDGQAINTINSPESKIWMDDQYIIQPFLC